MKQLIRVCDLAHELRISSLDVVQAAHALGINVIRATALLTSGQEYRIREWHANGHIRRRRVQSVVEQPALPTPPDECKSAKCDCCDYVFLYKPLQESHHLCHECRSHFEETGESFVRTLQRHEDHVAQSRRKVEGIERPPTRSVASETRPTSSATSGWPPSWRLLLPTDQRTRAMAVRAAHRTSHV